jgi:hypothetical protein
LLLPLCWKTVDLCWELWLNVWYLKFCKFSFMTKFPWPCEDIDGAYFGTTFPHLFLMSYGHLKPQKASQSYVPRVFGFKLNKPWLQRSKLLFVLNSPTIHLWWFSYYLMLCWNVNGCNKRDEMQEYYNWFTMKMFKVKICLLA